MQTFSATAAVSMSSRKTTKISGVRIWFDPFGPNQTTDYYDYVCMEIVHWRLTEDAVERIDNGKYLTLSHQKTVNFLSYIHFP